MSNQNGWSNLKTLKAVLYSIPVFQRTIMISETFYTYHSGSTDDIKKKIHKKEEWVGELAGVMFCSYLATHMNIHKDTQTPTHKLVPRRLNQK